MPYDVTAEAALKYEEVQKRLQKSITKLKQVTTMFLATIVKSGKKLPYGIQYMAKVFFLSLDVLAFLKCVTTRSVLLHISMMS